MGSGHSDAGGSIAKADIDDTALRIAEIVRPKLVADGMFLVGLDIVGDKLMEINVFSPGGLGSAQSFENVNFASAVVQALERKVQYMGFYQRNFNNIDLLVALGVPTARSSHENDATLSIIAALGQRVA